MSEIKFKTKAGRLTPYSFHCGYIEKYDGDKFHCELYHDCIYHVRLIPNGTKWTEWKTFETLTEARKQYAKFLKICKESK
jgi:hypothetical protein